MEVNWAVTARPTSNSAWSHKVLQLYLLISASQFQACSLHFKLDATNPSIPQGQVSLAYKAERVAEHLLFLPCHHFPHGEWREKALGLHLR